MFASEFCIFGPEFCIFLLVNLMNWWILADSSEWGDESWYGKPISSSQPYFELIQLICANFIIYSIYILETDNFRTTILWIDSIDMCNIYIVYYTIYELDIWATDIFSSQPYFELIQLICAIYAIDIWDPISLKESWSSRVFYIKSLLAGNGNSNCQAN